MAINTTVSTATMTAVKTALRISTNAYDSEITDLVKAAVDDMGLAGITNDSQTDSLVLRAIVTYCRLNFGQPDDYDRLKASYDEQKAQLSMCSGYTDWGLD